MKLLYLAGSLFSDADRTFLVELAKELEKSNWYFATVENQVKVFLPHRDAGDWLDVGKQAIFERDKDAIDACDLLVAVIDGADVDSGTAAEMGYAYAKGKPVFGFCTDLYRRPRQTNAFILGLMTSLSVDVNNLQTRIRQLLLEA